MKDIELYKKLNLLIMSGTAGPIDALAKKMGCKPRKVKDMIKILRVWYACPISYNPTSNNYFYDGPGHYINCYHHCGVEEVLKEIEELKKIIENMLTNRTSTLLPV